MLAKRPGLPERAGRQGIGPDRPAPLCPGRRRRRHGSVRFSSPRSRGEHPVPRPRGASGDAPIDPGAVSVGPRGGPAVDAQQEIHLRVGAHAPPPPPPPECSRALRWRSTPHRARRRIARMSRDHRPPARRPARRCGTPRASRSAAPARPVPARRCAGCPRRRGVDRRERSRRRHADGDAVLLTRPDKRFEPPGLRLIVEVDRVEVKPRPPRDLHVALRDGHSASGAASKQRRLAGDRLAGRDPPLAVVIRVAVGQQAQAGSGADLEQRQRLGEAGFPPRRWTW
jgi:hypothetical protein